MIKYLYVILILTVLNQHAVADGGSSKGVSLNFSPTFTGCGGIIPTSSIAISPVHIDYKSKEVYNGNEFCVWTLYPHEGIDKITIWLDEINYEAVTDGLVVYTWTGDNLVATPIDTSLTKKDIPGSYHFLAFSSDAGSNPDNNTGFKIRVEGTGRRGPRGSPPYFLPAEEGEFSYPAQEGQSQYENNERVSIVVQAQSSGISEMKQFLLKNIDVELNDDQLSVYTLYPYNYQLQGFELLDKVGSFDGTQKGAVWAASVYSGFPQLYLFTSDDRNTAGGFTIQWKNLPQN